MARNGSRAAGTVPAMAAGDEGRARQALELVHQGRRLLERSRIPGAQRKFRQALRLCATSVAARSHLALTYLLQQQYDRAAAEAQAALVLDPDHLLALTTLARAEAERRREVEAKEAAKRALRALWMRGRVGEAQREDVASVAAALAAVGDDRRLYQLYRLYVRGTPGPWDPHTLVILGVAAFNLGRYREARWLWRTALGKRAELDDILNGFLFAVDAVERERVPPLALDYRLPAGTSLAPADNPPGYVRAIALRTLWEGEDERAQEAALDLLSQLEDPWVAGFLFQVIRDPDLPDSLKMKAGVWLVERGFWSEDEPMEMHVEGALQEVLIRPRGAARLPKDAARWFEQALEARERGDDDTAEAAYRRVLAAVPGFVPALINLANICRQSDRCDEAEELLARALREEPGDPVVLLHLAVLRAQQEAYREAEAILNSLNPAELPRDLRPSYYGLAGHVALQLDQPNAAVAALRRGLDADPGNEQLAAALAAARVLAGDYFRGLTTPHRQPRWARQVIDPGLAWSEGLQRYTVPQLRSLARRLGLRGTSRLRKAQLAEAAALALRRRLPRVWQLLEPEEQEALLWLHAQGGIASYKALQDRFGSAEDDWSDWERNEPATVPMRLQWWGLVFVGRLPGETQPVAVIPPEVRRQLQEVWRR